MTPERLLAPWHPAGLPAELADSLQDPDRWLALACAHLLGLPPSTFGRGAPPAPADPRGIEALALLHALPARVPAADLLAQGVSGETVAALAAAGWLVVPEPGIVALRAPAPPGPDRRAAVHGWIARRAAEEAAAVLDGAGRRGWLVQYAAPIAELLAQRLDGEAAPPPPTAAGPGSDEVSLLGLLQALSLAGTNPAAVLTAARRLRSAGERDPRVDREEARALRDQGALDAAVACLVRARADAGPALRSDLWREQGVCHQRAGRLAEAEQAYQAALAEAPDDRRAALALGNLGAVAHDAGDFAKAEADYREALRRGHLHVGGRVLASWRNNLGLLRLESGDLGEAARQCADGLALVPPGTDDRLRAILLGSRGTTAWAEGRVELARVYLREAVRGVPPAADAATRALAWARLGAVEHTCGDDAAGARAWEHAELCAPDRVLPVLDLLRAWTSLRRHDLADVSRRVREAMRRPSAEAGGGQAPPLASSGGGQAPPLASSGGGQAPLHGRPLGALLPALSGGGQAPPLASSGGGQAPPLASSGGGQAPLHGRPQVALLPPGARWSDDARVHARLLRRALAARTDVLRVDPGGFTVPGGAPVSLARHAAALRVLHALAEAPGGLSAEALFEAGWPGVRVSAESQRNRLHVELARLRKLGLRDHLRSEAAGWRLAGPVAWLEDEDPLGDEPGAARAGPPGP